MTRKHRHTAALRECFLKHDGLGRVATLLVLAAFLLRAVVPAGWMPAPDMFSGGGTAVVICTGYGPETIHVDRDGKPLKQHDDDHSQPCLHGAVAPFVHIQSAALVAPPMFVVYGVARSEQRVAVDDLFRRSAGPPRAPPLSL